MSYKGMGMGSYYAFSNKQAYSGLGEYYQTSGLGCGCSGLGASGFTFNAADAWSRWLACASAWQTDKKVVSQCNVVNDIRAALSQLGYGMGTGQGQQWTDGDRAAMRNFCSGAGLTCPPETGVSKDVLLAMESMIKAGKVPGPEPVPDVQKIGDQYVVTEKKDFLTANWMYLAGGAVVVILVGAVVMRGKGKKEPRTTYGTGPQAYPQLPAGK